MPITSEPKGPKPTLVGLVKVQLFWQQVASTGPVYKAANVLHVKWSDNTNHSQSDLITLAGDVNTQVVTAFNPAVCNTATYIGCTVTSLGGDGLSATASSNTAGGDTGGMLPPQCAVTVTWKGATYWRGGKPRTYLPFPTANMLAASPAGGSQLAPVHTSALATRATTMISNMDALTIGGANPVLGVPSYYSKGAFRAVPLFIPYAAAVVHDRLDSQRRRSGKESVFSID